MFPPDAHLETHFMFDIHMPQVIVLHSQEQGFLFCCFFVYKLLYKSAYFTSSWYLVRWLCNSISAFIHLPRWPFPLNYELRLSITLYFWFYNYSPRSGISALQFWVEYVTLILIWVKVIYSQLGYSAGMFQLFAAYCSCGVWCRELKTTYIFCTLVICLEI